MNLMLSSSVFVLGDTIFNVTVVRSVMEQTRLTDARSICTILFACSYFSYAK